jgi:hypothetical protein
MYSSERIFDFLAKALELFLQRLIDRAGKEINPSTNRISRATLYYFVLAIRHDIDDELYFPQKSLIF